MKMNTLLPAVCASAILLTALFYQQGIGLNLLLVNVLFLLWLAFTKQLQFKNKTQMLSAGGFLLTGIFTVVSYTVYAYLIHFLALFIFVGMLNYAKARSFITAYGMAFLALFVAPIEFFLALHREKIRKNAFGRLLWKSRIFLLPLVIIAIFVSIYSFSNNVFGNMIGDLGLVIQNGINYIFENLNFSLLFTFIFCLFISIFLLFRSKNKGLSVADEQANEAYVRTKKVGPRYFRVTGLKSEYRAGVFLLVTLNLLLLFVNMIDIDTVWLNFAWEGQTLKEFVHEGTYLLILSILISIALVLYFFRGNLNFYKKNKWLKVLSYIWLCQNAVLALSVMMRNYWYIEYFALAYKRIGVIVFLLLTIFGLYTVFIKIRDKKSAFYLFKVNAFAWFIALVLTAAVPWDSFIAKYNFAHADQSYLHLNYLYDFSDKALPAMGQDEATWAEIEAFQKKNFETDSSDMTFDTFRKRIEWRKGQFKEKWEAKNLLSWNLAEYLAYKRL